MYLLVHRSLEWVTCLCGIGLSILCIETPCGKFFTDEFSVAGSQGADLLMEKFRFHVVQDHIGLILHVELFDELPSKVFHFGLKMLDAYAGYVDGQLCKFRGTLCSNQPLFVFFFKHPEIMLGLHATMHFVGKLLHCTAMYLCVLCVLYVSNLPTFQIYKKYGNGIKTVMVTLYTVHVQAYSEYLRVAYPDHFSIIFTYFA